MKKGFFRSKKGFSNQDVNFSVNAFLCQTKQEHDRKAKSL
ncbi:hypothetical protein SAMN05421640_0036 [Ekhidna lutea]|uniref:Uncharacterized protein n=1 Tax=Ekhidna lutea TaxID=447679 RepID=A0A239EBD5_EKHLU|nr:hypothetical protein SAMN05421640_0036 [Ekhidna lutea]